MRRFKFRFDPNRVGLTKVLGPLEALVMGVLLEGPERRPLLFAVTGSLLVTLFFVC